MALSGIEPVVVEVQPTPILHPSGAAENAKNPPLPHVKNFGFGLPPSTPPAEAGYFSSEKYLIVRTIWLV